MSEKLRTIRLYGILGTKFGRVHRLAVHNAREAAIALSVIVPGFEHFLMNSSEKGIEFAVFSGRRNLSADQLEDPAGSQDIRIAPIVRGSKQGGLFQIIAGVVLLVVGFFTGGSTWGPALMLMGGALAISGAMSMFTQQPLTKETGDGVNNRASKSFSGVVNTVAQGNPVPLLYGELIVGSAVISAGIYPEDQA